MEAVEDILIDDSLLLARDWLSQPFGRGGPDCGLRKAHPHPADRNRRIAKTAVGVN
jgi:hypothetical protein